MSVYFVYFAPLDRSSKGGILPNFGVFLLLKSSQKADFHHKKGHFHHTVMIFITNYHSKNSIIIGYNKVFIYSVTI